MNTYYTEGFSAPAANQGQTVAISFGLDVEAEVIVVRRHDASDNTTIYTAYADGDPDASWEPWNSAPKLGQELGPCVIAEDDAA
jgi:hypothetical protein